MSIFIPKSVATKHIFGK